jgi:hypothetical protein
LLNERGAGLPERLLSNLFSNLRGADFDIDTRENVERGLLPCGTVKNVGAHLCASFDIP